MFVDRIRVDGCPTRQTPEHVCDHGSVVERWEIEQLRRCKVDSVPQLARGTDKP
jgi:hypothetical protein